jgi:hypothetical protein
MFIYLRTEEVCDLDKNMKRETLKQKRKKPLIKTPHGPHLANAKKYGSVYVLVD